MKFTAVSLIWMCLGWDGGFAEDPILWRKDGSGHFEGTKVPVDWVDEANRIWEVPLGHSNASPIKVGDRLYLTEEPSTLLCVDAKSGELLWKRENEYLDLLGLSDSEMAEAEETLLASKALDRKIAKLSYTMNRLERRANKTKGWKEAGPVYFKMLTELDQLGEEKVEMHEDNEYGNVVLPSVQSGNGYASYVPTSDGEVVYASFGTGVVVAYSKDGERRWHRILEHPDHNYGGSTFPLLADEVLVVRFKDFVGLDKGTGEELWRVSSSPTFGSPILFRVEGQAFLFSARGQVIRVSDGKEISPELVKMNEEFHNMEAFCTPIKSEGSLFLVEGNHIGKYGPSSVYRLQIPNTVEDLETKGLKRLWKTSLKNSSYFASPLVHEGIFYVASRKKFLIALDAENGEQIYSQKIEGTLDPLISSITLVGDSLFLGSGDGVAVIVEPGRTFKERSRHHLLGFRSTPIFDSDRGYLRLNESLVAFGEK